MLTREIVRLDEQGLVKIRIIEKDGKTCLSEPCYPLSMFSGDDEIKGFTDIVLNRTVRSRELIEAQRMENGDPEPEPQE